jgi:hypothetical protein
MLKAPDGDYILFRIKWDWSQEHVLRWINDLEGKQV